MSSDIDKRAVFFLGAAIVCALLVPVTPEAHRNVGLGLVGVYALLAVASWLDFRSNG
jgi:hypothetical protein